VSEIKTRNVKKLLELVNKKKAEKEENETKLTQRNFIRSFLLMRRKLFYWHRHYNPPRLDGNLAENGKTEAQPKMI
jgi:hypothetical protein